MNKIKESRALSFLRWFWCTFLRLFLESLYLGTLSAPCFWLCLLPTRRQLPLYFLFSIIFRNASVYDPDWSVQPIVILSCFLFGREISALTIFIWGIRLTANWAYTFKGLNFQDWRYTLLFLFVSILVADKRQFEKIGFDEYKKHTCMLLTARRK